MQLSKTDNYQQDIWVIKIHENSNTNAKLTCSLEAIKKLLSFKKAGRMWDSQTG